MYLSAPYLKEFCSRSAAAARKITDDFEIILVNDGSPDNSLDIALSISREERKVKVLDLSRNFGHHKAAMTGLSYAEGNLVFLIDCDLEEDPENLELFYNEMRRNPDCDVVHGVVEKPKGGLLKRAIDRLFYIFFNMLSGVNVDRKVSFSRLMSARYVKSLVSHGENELFLLGLWYITGYKQIPVKITTRYKGATSYTLGKKISLAFNALTSFSYKPMLFISYIGIFMSFISGGYIAYLLFRKFFSGATLHGWTSMIVSIWFVGGLIMFSMGIVGIYISKIFIETKNRPYTIVRQFYKDGDSDENTGGGN